MNGMRKGRRGTRAGVRLGWLSELAWSIRWSIPLCIALCMQACKDDSASNRQRVDGAFGDAAVADSTMDGSAPTVGGDCDDFFDSLLAPAPDDDDAGISLEFEVEPDSWGDVVAEFQELPENAELCGAYYFGANGEEPGRDSGDRVIVAISSSLEGAALRAFYDPLMQQAGCWFAGDPAAQNLMQLAWDCPAEKGGVVIAASAGNGEFYTLSSEIP